MTTALWDVETTDMSGIHVRDCQVTRVTTRDVVQFCQRYHYAVTHGAANWRYGLWHGPVLLGVVTYNLPTRETCASVFGPDHRDKVWHMARLAMADAAPHNSESRLIAGSFRLARNEYPDIWACLTYAAQDAGHVGYVYQATNALYTGTGGDPVIYTDQAGMRRSSYLDAHGVSPARAESMGWTRSVGLPKHRYVYILGDRKQRRARLAQLRLPTLPYPKGPTARDKAAS